MDIRLKKKKEVATLTALPSILLWLKLRRWWQCYKIRGGKTQYAKIKAINI